MNQNQYRELSKEGLVVLPRLLSKTSISNILSPGVKGVPFECRLSLRRKKIATWLGVTQFPAYLNTRHIPGIEGSVEYGNKDGRIDLQLSKELVEALLTTEDQQQIQNIILLLNKNSKDPFRISHIHLLIAYANEAKIQDWHQDNASTFADGYFTVFIPLNHEEKMGVTEFIPQSCSKKSPPVKEESYSPQLSPGDAVMFSGKLWHRGHANQSNQNRYILYFVLTNQPNHLVKDQWKI